MEEKTASTVGLIIGLGVLASVVAVGIIAGSFWVGLLAFASLTVGFFSISLLVATPPNFIAGFILWMLEVGLLIWAMTLGDMAGRWWWTPMLLYSAFPPLLGGLNAWSEDSPFIAVINLVLAALTGIFSILAPLSLYPILSSETASFDLAIVWVWASIAVAFIFLGLAYFNAEDWNPGRFILFALLGVAALGAAYWLADFNGGWWWLAPFLLAAGLIGVGASELSGEGGAGSAVGWLMVVLCLGIAIAGPLWIAPAMQDRLGEPGGISVAEPTPAPTRAPTEAPTPLAASATPRPSATRVPPTTTPTRVVAALEEQGEVSGPGFFPAIWSFLVEAVTSLWGIAHLIIIFIIGQLWVRRFGGGIVLLALLLAVGFLGGSNQETLDTFNQVISSSPAGWMYDLGVWSEEMSGTMGWGYLLLGLVVALVLIPATRYSYRMSREMTKANISQGNIGDTRMQRFFESRSEEYGAMFMGWIVFYAVSFGLLVSVWIAMRRIAEANAVSDLAFFFVPNLTIPSFKWVFAWGVSVWPYFALGAILLAFNLGLGFIHRSYKGVQIASIYASPLTAVVSAVLLTLFVPAGTQLFSLGQSILMVPIVLLMFRTMKAEDKITKQIEGLKSAGQSAVYMHNFSSARGIVASLKELGAEGIKAASELDLAILAMQRKIEEDRNKRLQTIREAEIAFHTALDQGNLSSAETQIDKLEKLSPKPDREIREMRSLLKSAREDDMRKDITTAKRLFTMALNKDDFDAAEEQIQVLKAMTQPPWDDISEMQGRLNIARSEKETTQRRIAQLKRDVEHEISKGRWDEARKLIGELEPLAGAAAANVLRKKLNLAVEREKEEAERRKVVSQPLFKLGNNLTGMVIRQASQVEAGATRYAGGIQPDDRIACLTQNGELFWMIRAQPSNPVRLGLKYPCGLLEIQDDQLLAVDASGELVRVEITDQGAFNTIERASTRNPIAAFGLNSYRSMLAYLGGDSSSVSGFFLANKIEHEFYTQDDLAPALAFSADSISLAVGTKDGGLHVIDIPTRQVKDIFDPVSLEDFPVTTGGPLPSISPEQRAVEAVYAGDDHVWVSVHANHVTRFSKDQGTRGVFLHDMIKSSAIDSERKLLAVGTEGGGVYTYFLADLTPQKFYRAHEAAITRLQFAPDNRLLICVGAWKDLRSLLIG